ncbi:hypothetical protein GUJ93_ZPchr0007g5824 [Zizania palustris]|uniref:Phytosulfokine n=1 Tax=Zizania palustris TaxID=103762 RepID=A0A8J5VR89_ZIZPA|nr:hypothetical protein GUJ93_ZPchr0007g5824 [Zizania palustris]
MAPRPAALALAAVLAVLLLASSAPVATAIRPQSEKETAASKVVVAPDEDVEAEKVDGVGCEGLGEEECMARRTLAAHTDYIYTQQHHN